MIATRWTTEWSEVEVSDDGPGFSEALLDELGTPFISTRQGVEGHMGLGVFIAKTLLERTGRLGEFRQSQCPRRAARQLSCAGQIPSSRLHSGKMPKRRGHE